jgi:ADP-heptose:LPS heptosyltransferase
MKNSVLVFLLLLFSISLLAQPPGEKVRQMKRAFFNEKLALTESERNIFWPLYEKFEQERRQLIKNKVDAATENRNFESMSTAELNQYIDSMLEMREKEAALQKKYMTEFRKILPLQKAARLVTLEEEFRIYLMRLAKEKAGEPPPPGKPWGK